MKKYKKFSGAYIKDKLFKKTYNQLESSGKGMRPDLVFHASQKCRCEEEQLLIIECKIEPELNEIKFNKDLFKLFIYKSELHFRYAVYLIVNSKYDKIMKFVEEYEKHFWKAKKKGTIILIKEKHGEQIKEIRLPIG